MPSCDDREGSVGAYAEIANLIFTYAERIDAGDFEGVASLFARAEITAAGTDLARRGYDEVLAMYADGTRRHPDGTPRTKHVTTNLVIEVDDATQTASGRSYFTVLQAVPGLLALQPIIAGRYHDRFAREEGSWRFVSRHMVVDLTGDLGQHLIGPYRPG